MPVPNLESHLVMARLKGWATVIEWRCPLCHHKFILDGVVFFEGVSIQCPKCLKAGVNANKIYLINRGRTSKLTKHGWIPEETKEVDNGKSV